MFWALDEESLGNGREDMDEGGRKAVSGVLVLETVLGKAFLQAWDEKQYPDTHRAKRRLAKVVNCGGMILMKDVREDRAMN